MKFDGILYKVHCAAMKQINHLTMFGEIICINYENYLKYEGKSESKVPYFIATK